MLFQGHPLGLKGFFDRTAESAVWRLVMVLLAVPCFGAFAMRRSMTQNADFLGGRPEIERFLKINVMCLAVALAVFLIEIFLVYVLCVGKENTPMKLIACITGLTVSIITSAMFVYSVVNIRSDLKSTTKAEVNDYVLSSTDGKYYLGFEDGGEYAMMPVKKSLYDELSKGSERSDGLHSNIYDMITERSYDNVTEYKDSLSVEYYFNSVMIESAKLNSK